MLVYGRTSTSVVFNLIFLKKKQNLFSHKDRRPYSQTRSRVRSFLPLLVLRFDTGFLFDAIWCEVQKPRADALRLFVRMGDPYDRFEGRIWIVDLIEKRILYHRGQCGVQSGCRFLQIPELDQK